MAVGQWVLLLCDELLVRGYDLVILGHPGCPEADQGHRPCTLGPALKLCRAGLEGLDSQSFG